MSQPRRSAALVAALVLLLAAPGLALAQEESGGEPEQSKAKHAEAGTPDENVKQAEPKNVPGEGPPAPESKGGPQAKGPICYATLDNHTRLYVKFFVDGAYQGTVTPWGSLVGAALSGPTELYARADYTDGSYDYWGPRTVRCDDRFVWQIYP